MAKRNTRNTANKQASTPIDAKKGKLLHLTASKCNILFIIE